MLTRRSWKRGEDAWEDLKDGAESASDEMGKAIEKFRIPFQVTRGRATHPAPP